jgi:hypothetical protein
VHQGELGAACETCHSSSTFTRKIYTHTGATPAFFAGQHTAVTCEKCHVSKLPTQPLRTGAASFAVSFKGATTACVTCHKDVHLGQEGVSCEACHTLQAPKFAVTAFAHDTRTTFALAGKHGTVACVDCHKVETGLFPAGAGTARRLKGAPRDCVGCHADVHLGQVSDRCETCHQPASFKLAAYTHRATKANAAFFVGRHVSAVCADCHKPAARAFPKGAGTAMVLALDSKCVSCHVDKHRGALGPNCAACHRP